MAPDTEWTSRQVAIAGCVPSVRVAQLGPPSAPPVLLLHGWPQTADVWKQVDRQAFGERRVVAIDLPGFGGTDPMPGRFSFPAAATIVQRVLDGLGIDRCEVVAHDVGAWVAFHLDPRRVTGLLAIGVPPPWMSRRDLFRALPRFSYQLPLILPVIGPALIRRGRIVSRYLQRGAWRDRTWAGPGRASDVAYREQFRDRRRARASARLYRTLLLREIVGRLLWNRGGDDLRRWTGADVGLLLAANDRVFGTSFFRHTPLMGFEVIPECGHFVMDEQPALTATAITRFLAGAPSPTSTAAAPAGSWAASLRATVNATSERFDRGLRTDVLPPRRRRDRPTDRPRQEVAVYLAQPER